LNIILIAFVLGFFSDVNFNLDLPFIAVIWNGLLALTPSFLLEFLTDLFIKCADNVRTTIKRFLGWIYSKEDYKPKVKKWKKEVSDPFSNIHNQGIGGDTKPPIDFPVEGEGGEGRGVPKYVVVIVLVVATVGFTYYMFPELYYAGYTYVKGKLFPDNGTGGSNPPRGGPGGGTGGNPVTVYKKWKGKAKSGAGPSNSVPSSSTSGVSEPIKLTYVNDPAYIAASHDLDIDNLPGTVGGVDCQQVFQTLPLAQQHLWLWMMLLKRYWLTSFLVVGRLVHRSGLMLLSITLLNVHPGWIGLNYRQMLITM
jgi:hypothetical protein